jgi:hypothetical protein
MSASVVEFDAPTSIIVRAFQPENAGPMPGEAARYLVNLRPAVEDLRRADQLAARARAGQLSAAEEAEIEEHRRVGKLFEAIKLVARLTLQHSPDSPI